MCLSCVVTLTAFQWVSFVMYVWDICWEKNGHRTLMISTGVQRRCRLLMMYEVRRSVHQRAGRLLLHPETPPSLPCCLCHLPKWGSITLSPPPPPLHITASPLTLFTCALFLDVYWSPFFLFLFLDHGFIDNWSCFFVLFFLTRWPTLTFYSRKYLLRLINWFQDCWMVVEEKVQHTIKMIRSENI